MKKLTTLLILALVALTTYSQSWVKDEVDEFEGYRQQKSNELVIGRLDKSAIGVRSFVSRFIEDGDTAVLWTLYTPDFFDQDIQCDVPEKSYVAVKFKNDEVVKEFTVASEVDCKDYVWITVRLDKKFIAGPADMIRIYTDQRHDVRVTKSAELYNQLKFAFE